MHFTEVELPEDREELIGCYIYLTVKLRGLWVEYVSFVETPFTYSTGSLYRIVFYEMDFYEALRARVGDRLPRKVVSMLGGMDDYSNW